MTRVWILTEELLRGSALSEVLRLTARQLGGRATVLEDQLYMEPRGHPEGARLGYQYSVSGAEIPDVDEISLVLAKGTSSFVDCLVFIQDERPDYDSIPALAIEITKTRESESRNTFLGQRGLKFGAVSDAYPQIHRVMLFDTPSGVAAEQPHTESVKFAARCLATIGVEISLAGATFPRDFLVPFASTDELISARRQIRKPTNGIPITISAKGDTVVITGRLEKSERFGHDPNKGLLSLIILALRSIGEERPIVIHEHQLTQDMLGTGDEKFMRICISEDVGLAGLYLPKATNKTKPYWKYEEGGEKVVSILTHVVIESAQTGSVFFSDHAGAERSYFLTPQGHSHPVDKATAIPDLAIINRDGNEALLIEAERDGNVADGRLQLEGFDAFENLTCDHYPSVLRCRRGIITHGGNPSRLATEESVWLALGDDGTVCLSEDAPPCIVEAFQPYVLT